MDEVRYELQEEDAIAFSVVNARLSPSYRKMIQGLQVASSLLFVLMALPILEEQNHWTTWFIPALGIAAVWIVVPKVIWWSLPWVYRRHMRTGKNTAILGSHELQLLQDGLKRTHSQSESKVSWAAVDKLVSTRQYLGIYVAANNAFLVPKRSFDSPENERSFRARVEQLSGKVFAETVH